MLFHLHPKVQNKKKKNNVMGGTHIVNTHIITLVQIHAHNVNLKKSKITQGITTHELQP
jgi:hypothetical protein